ncbi:MAG: N(4)-(beta-N-acetylglucosaminyl)-L-asparaginase [Planctomycetota bacterium]|nr:N(4)-(beta-N-acetylglucosaminyl)-L-asparaginase [Planctomycetota bacterium]
MSIKKSPSPRPDRRAFLGTAAGVALAPLVVSAAEERGGGQEASGRPAKGPAMVGSANGLAGMKEAWPRLLDGEDPLTVALDVVARVEADPNDHSVGLGGLPNERGAVQLDSACMHGPTHNSGAVAAIENILHPSQVARLVMERTDHCLIVGRGAYEFAREHGHPHTELLTDAARAIWLRWKETMSDKDDRFPAPRRENEGTQDEKHGSLLDGVLEMERHGTIHCSALSVRGEVGCTTTTSGLAWKIPGRVGDSPIVGAGLYCDNEAGSAGSTGRGEAAILSNGSFAIVELMRQGKSPREAGLTVLERIVRQVERQAKWQPGLMGGDGRPSFGVNFYALGLDGSWTGVTLKGGGRFAVADAAGGPRHEPLTALLE